MRIKIALKSSKKGLAKGGYAKDENSCQSAIDVTFDKLGRRNRKFPFLVVLPMDGKEIN
jgi:hypothetical protein